MDDARGPSGKRKEIVSTGGGAAELRSIVRKYSWIPKLLGGVATYVLFVATLVINHQARGRLEIYESAVDLMSPLSLGARGAPLKIEWDKGFGVSPDPVPLKKLHLVRLKFENVGNRPIEWGKAFVEPIKFEIQGPGEVLALVPDPSPLSQRVELQKRRSAQDFTVQFDFLNPGDSFFFHVYHSSDVDSHVAICAGSRVLGHEPLSVRRELPESRGLWNVGTMFFIICAVVIANFLLDVGVRIARTLRERKTQVTGSRS